MIHVVTNTKGGAGKSAVAVLLGCVLAQKGKNFKIVELDDNNDSLVFENSEIFTQDNIKSLKLKDKEQALSDMLFDLMSDDSMDYIVDIGGGNDTFEVLDALKSTNLEKTYYIPTTRIKKYLKNAVDTFEYIKDEENTIFALNQYTNLENIKDEFLYFFGSKKMGVNPVDEKLLNSKYIPVPFSNYIQIAEDDEMSLFDLASISMQMQEDDARKIFFEEANGSREHFHQMMVRYWNSQKAAQDLLEISQNFNNIQ